MHAKNLNLTTFVAPEVLISATIYKKCGAKSKSGRQEGCILKTQLELPTLNPNLYANLNLNHMFSVGS